MKTTTTIRMDDELRTAAERVALITYRSTSSLIEYAVRLYIEKNYPLAFDPNAKVTLSLDEAPEAQQ